MNILYILNMFCLQRFHTALIRLALLTLGGSYLFAGPSLLHLPASAMVTIQLPWRDFPCEDYWPSGLISVAFMGLSHFYGRWMQHHVSSEETDRANSLFKIIAGPWKINFMWNKFHPWSERLLVSSTGKRINDEHLWNQLAWTFLIRTYQSQHKSATNQRHQAPWHAPCGNFTHSAGFSSH